MTFQWIKLNNIFMQIVQTNNIVKPLFHPVIDRDQLFLALQNKHIEAEIIVFRVHTDNQAMIDENMIEDIVLQIVDQYVLHINPLNKNILSYFKCDYEINFEILRKQPNIPNTLGDPEGIRFIFKSEDNRIVQLKINNQYKKVMQAFGRVLGRKYIIQLGFHTSFKAIQKIGKGLTACVYNALRFSNKKEVAIKSFKRSIYFAQDNGNGKLSFLNEFKILTLLNHRNICQLISVYESDNSTYVILEIYPLSLYGYLQKCGFPSVEQAKIMMINLLEGISYVHEKGIMHRDLKLQNIMVKKLSNGKIIPVIIDFGLAQYISSTKYLYTRCGTPGYVAPQVLKIKSTDPVQTYTEACDIFSIGVIFHILLFKKPLFEGSQVKEVIRKNCQCMINFNDDKFTKLPALGKDLMERMLCSDPKKRITAKQALNHEFLIDERKKLQIQAPNMYATQYSIFN